MALAMKIDVDNLRDKITSVTEAMGFELADLSAPVVGGRLILRAFIHSPIGVTLDDCASVSRELSDMLDTLDIIESRYTLEVSSLGLDRPLLTPGDFRRRIGERVKVSYNLDGMESKVEGILVEGDDDNIRIDRDGEVVTIPVGANPRGKIII
jgi:ribosome maturation factor RimP